MLTWSVKWQKFSRQWIRCTQGDKVEVFDALVVVSHNTESFAAAKIRKKGHICDFLFFGRGMETDKTQLLKDKWVTQRCR